MILGGLPHFCSSHQDRNVQVEDIRLRRIRLKGTHLLAVFGSVGLRHTSVNLNRFPCSLLAKRADCNCTASGDERIRFPGSLEGRAFD